LAFKYKASVEEIDKVIEEEEESVCEDDEDTEDNIYLFFFFFKSELLCWEGYALMVHITCGQVFKRRERAVRSV